MSHFVIPLDKQELLHHMLQAGGKALCPLHRPEQTIHASVEVELSGTSAVINVELGGHTGELTLKRSDRANHLHLRDFIQDIANGRIESADPAPGSAFDDPIFTPMGIGTQPKSTSARLSIPAAKMNELLDDAETVIANLRKQLSA